MTDICRHLKMKDRRSKIFFLSITKIQMTVIKIKRNIYSSFIKDLQSAFTSHTSHHFLAAPPRAVGVAPTHEKMLTGALLCNWYIGIIRHQLRCTLHIEYTLWAEIRHVSASFERTSTWTKFVFNFTVFTVRHRPFDW